MVLLKHHTVFCYEEIHSMEFYFYKQWQRTELRVFEKIRNDKPQQNKKVDDDSPPKVPVLSEKIFWKG